MQDIKNVVLFDLGNTLVHYFEGSEFYSILKQSISEVQRYLSERGSIGVSFGGIRQRIEDENFESSDGQVRPLERRLLQIFQLDVSLWSNDLVMAMCRRFMNPIFAIGKIHRDTVPTLKQLKSSHFRTAIISNTTWGSPANLWREELERLGLTQYFDVVVFCRDVGWRKPARQIFDFTLNKLKAQPQNCVYVGDDPRWDFLGPRAVGIEALIIDRKATSPSTLDSSYLIKDLYELLGRLGHL